MCFSKAFYVVFFFVILFRKHVVLLPGYEILDLAESNETGNLLPCKFAAYCNIGEQCAERSCKGFTATPSKRHICVNNKICEVFFSGNFFVSLRNVSHPPSIRIQPITTLCGQPKSTEVITVSLPAPILNSTITTSVIPPNLFFNNVVGKLKLCGCTNNENQPAYQCRDPFSFNVPLGTLELLDGAVSYPLNKSEQNLNNVVAYCIHGIKCDFRIRLKKLKSKKGIKLNTFPGLRTCGNAKNSYGQDITNSQENILRNFSNCNLEDREILCNAAPTMFSTVGPWRVCSCSFSYLESVTSQCASPEDYSTNIGLIFVVNSTLGSKTDSFGLSSWNNKSSNLVNVRYTYIQQEEMNTHTNYNIEKVTRSLIPETTLYIAKRLLSQEFPMVYETYKSQLMSKNKQVAYDHTARLNFNRNLQSMNGDLGVGIDTLPSLSSYDDGYSLRPRQHEKCDTDTDCFNTYGKCENSVCRGFLPDMSNDRWIRCVDGYTCDIKEKDIPGVGINSDFQVIAIGMSELCGAVESLKLSESIFANSNRWKCSDEFSESCVFSAGVGGRRNRSIFVEGVRLCGCPNIDANGNTINCDHKREFYVPLGTVSVQECTRNAHCADHGLASCSFDHCVRGTGVAATAGLKVFQCLTSRSCNIKTLTTKTVNEALKILPIASTFHCGAKAALNPDAIDDSALPCIIDINNDGECEINLGIAKSFGTTRLCGCVGDKGGNGRDCDQVEDFTEEVAMVQVGECIVDSDCGKKGAVCIKGMCIEDNFPPYVVQSIPGNKSHAVPPVNEIVLIWNENIKYTKTKRKIVIKSADIETPFKWEMEVRDPATYKIAEAGYSIKIKGRELRVIPDITMSSFPEGTYVVGYEGGIVSDLADNFNHGAINLQYTVSKTAGCMHLYITGFSAKEINPNGIYTAIEPKNNHAAWIKGGQLNQLYLYWKEKDLERNQPGNWVISEQYENRGFIAYADLKLMEELGHEGEIRPPGSKWKKWENHAWVQHPDITITCRSVIDKQLPKLTQMIPSSGSVSINPLKTNITLKFSEPVTYGHWANISFISREHNHIVVINPDFYAGMRGINIKSDMHGSIELNLNGLDDLYPGTLYDIVAQYGAITDLAYNPWDQENHQLFFTTYGVSCPTFHDLGSGYIIKGNGTSHHSAYEIRCAEGYTSQTQQRGQYISHNDVTDESYEDDYEEEEEEEEENVTGHLENNSSTSQTVLCVDGKWEQIRLNCFADCPSYFGLGPEYKVTGTTVNNHFHGVSLPISCASESIIIMGTGKSTMVCNNGNWDIGQLRCGVSCGPFPSLGPNYNVTQDRTSDDVLTGSVGIGARRIVSCATEAVATKGIEPESVVCEETGWSHISLTCHIACDTPPQYNQGYIIEGSGNSHESERQLSCAKGFQTEWSINPLTHLNSTILRCNEGRWIPDHNNFICYRNCGQFNKGDGYIATPLIESLYGTHQSSVKVRCSHNAIHESGPELEILKCIDGTWEMGQIICNAPCSSIEISLGTSYIADISSHSEKVNNEYYHGTMGVLYCSPLSEIIQGVPSERIICNNGHWISLSYKTKKNPYQLIPQRPTLVCRNRCGPFNKDIRRFVDYGGIDLTDQLILNPVIAGTTRRIVCQEGFSPENTDIKEGSLLCQDGKWIEQTNFECLRTCNKDAISNLFQKGYDLVDPQVIIVEHNNHILLKCRKGFSIRLGQLTSTTFSSTCYNGHFILPDIICGMSTCTDGIKNGDEQGIDCGGACLQNCTSCRLNPLNCETSCTDGLQNGDEEGIDCGGNFCEPCRSCIGLPKEIQSGMIWTVNRGLDYSNETYQDTYKSVHYIAGTYLDVMCGKGYDQRSSSPTLRFQTFHCDQRTLKWSLSDGSVSFVLRCAKPTCFDKTLNNNEVEVDCGGQCINPCPLCNDNIMNGDEEGIDCGGSRCIPCKNCNQIPFKSLREDTVIEGVESSLSTEWKRIHSFDLIGTHHGSIRKIYCLNKPSSYAALKCNNGVWDNISGPMSINQLDCYETAVQTTNEHTWTDIQYQQFETPNLPETTVCHTQLDNTDCCQMIHLFNDLMSGACGALLYGSKNQKVNGFCTGECLQKLNILLNTYSNRKGQLCHLQPLLVELSQLYCVTGRPIISDTASISEAYYCFSSAHTVLSDIKNLKDLRGPSLNAACQPESCFLSNFRYFEVLKELGIQIKKLNRQVINQLSNRHLRDELDQDFISLIENGRIHHLPTGLINHKPNSHLISEVAQQFLNTIENQSVQFVYNPIIKKRDLRAFLTQSYQTLPEILLSNQYSRQLLNLMCLKDSKGNSCAPLVQDILSKETLRMASNTSNFDYLGHSDLNTMMPSNSCVNKCYWEMTRHIGQSLYLEGKSALHPYTAMLGLLMRTYGRVACQYASPDATSCGDILSSNLLNTPANVRLSTGTSISTNKKDQFLHCTCPLIYIGDGKCDLECFNPFCDFDDKDCTLERMFPLAYQRLNSILPLTDPCHPLHKDFQCLTTFTSLNINNAKECRKKIINVINHDGCCVATRWEVLREALLLEEEMRHLSVKIYSQKNITTENYIFPLSIFEQNEFILDRSTSWIEATCQLSLNRVCSGGIVRSKIRIRFTILKLQYHSVFESLMYRDLPNILTHTIRQTMSNLLALPLYDITEIRFWPGSIDVEVVIDPGVMFSEIYKTLDRLQLSGELITKINHAIFDMLQKYIKNEMHLNILLGRHDTEHHNRRLLYSIDKDDISTLIKSIDIDPQEVKDNALSITETPQLPYSGTLDMHDLVDSLPLSSCPSTPYSIDIEKKKQDHNQNNNHTTDDDNDFLAYEMENVATWENPSHGTSRQIFCRHGYEPSLYNSGPSPQFLTCNRGRWITSEIGQPKLICKRPCNLYEHFDIGFNKKTMILTTDHSNKDGAKRIISCTAGHRALEGTRSPETLQCRNGIWDRRSLECIKNGDYNNGLLNGMCGNLSLSTVIKPSEVFILKHVLSSNVHQDEFNFSFGEQMSNNSSHTNKRKTIKKSMTKFILWSLSCTRGYISGTDYASPIAIICINDTLLLATQTFHVSQWDIGTSHSTLGIESNNELLKPTQAEIFRIYYDYKKKKVTDPETNDIIKELTIHTPFELIQCKPDIRTAPWVSPSQPGLSDVAFYCVIFFGCFFILALGILIFYCRRTECMNQPFFDHPGGIIAKEDQLDTTLSSKDIKPANDIDLDTGSSAHSLTKTYICSSNSNSIVSSSLASSRADLSLSKTPESSDISFSLNGVTQVYDSRNISHNLQSSTPLPYNKINEEMDSVTELMNSQNYHSHLYPSTTESNTTHLFYNQCHTPSPDDNKKRFKNRQMTTGSSEKKSFHSLDGKVINTIDSKNDYSEDDLLYFQQHQYIHQPEGTHAADMLLRQSSSLTPPYKKTESPCKLYRHNNYTNKNQNHLCYPNQIYSNPRLDNPKKDTYQTLSSKYRKKNEQIDSIQDRISSAENTPLPQHNGSKRRLTRRKSADFTIKHDISENEFAITHPVINNLQMKELLKKSSSEYLSIHEYLVQHTKSWMDHNYDHSNHSSENRPNSTSSYNLESNNHKDNNIFQNRKYNTCADSRTETGWQPYIVEPDFSESPDDSDR